jgi:hypothetical protein
MLGGRRRSRTRSYKLADPFLIFFFRYIRPNRAVIERNRRGENLYRAIAGPTIQQYYGYAFERLCEEAMEAMLDRLGLRLADVVEMGPFFQQQRGQRGGVQVDWLIVRRDGVWTLLEFKYGKSPVGMQVVHDVEQKIQHLGVPPEISVEAVLVSAAGATRAVQRSGFFHPVIELRDLV